MREKSFLFNEGAVVDDVWDRERQILVWRGMDAAAVRKDRHKNEAKLESWTYSDFVSSAGD